MWLLINEEKCEVYKIIASRENIVGRINGDLVLSDDMSISRRHAILRLIDNGQKVMLKDLASKYGTSVKCNEAEFRKTNANEEIEIKVGDVIKFGIQSNNWQLEYFPIVLTTSTLRPDEKKEIQGIICELDGALLSNWSSQCTHLVMNQLTITVKVVCALADFRPIVTPAYWKKLYHCITSMKLPLPDIKDFIPDLVEATLNPNGISFLPNSKRKTLFSGTVFVASTRAQMSRVEMMVTHAGGTVEEFIYTKMGNDKFLNKNCILLMHSGVDSQSSGESQIPNGYKRTVEMLKKHGVRCIPESDIGLSVLYCSMEQYCNPLYRVQILSQNQNLLNQIKAPPKVLVPETQNLTCNTFSATLEIPETSFESNNSTTNRKRICDREAEENVIQKRIRRQQNNDKSLFASSPEPSTSYKASESSSKQPSTCRSPDLFSFSSEKELFSTETPQQRTKIDDQFMFPSETHKGTSSLNSTTSSRKYNTGSNIFDSIVEKNKTKTKDSDFTFPSEREENQRKLSAKKRSWNDDFEFNLPTVQEDKRPKLNNTASTSKNNASFIDNDPFNFPSGRAGSSRTLKKSTNDKKGLWGSIVGTRNEQNSQSERIKQQDKIEHNSSSDEEITMPVVHNESRNLNFLISSDEEIKKDAFKPIPLSSFVSKPIIRKEDAESEEEEEEEDLNKLVVGIEVKCLVRANTSVQEVVHEQGRSNVVNFKKFKKTHTGVLQGLPYIIGGNDLISFEV